MSDHPINNLMDTAMQKIREMVDVNTIVGEPITSPDGMIIIPVSRVSYGFAAGGSDIPNKTDKQVFGGGSGAGISIVPIAFVVVYDGEVKLLNINANTTTADRVVSLVPELFDKVSQLFKKDKDKSKTSQE